MNTKDLNVLVRKQYVYFQKDFDCILPDIQKTISLPSTECVNAKFNIKDLYQRKYFLYVGNSFKNKPEHFIIPSLYHEFTHILDSLKFLEYDYNEFKSMIGIYSEIHASEIQMDKILEINKTISSIDDTIMYDNNSTIRKILNKSINEMQNSFSFNYRKTNSRITRRELNIMWMCYLIGKLISLKKHGLKYDFVCNTVLDDDYASLFNELYNIYVSKQYDKTTILSFYEKFEDMIFRKIIKSNHI